MRLTDRLLDYLNHKGITIYAFEKSCGVGNGYIGKQAKGRGSVGSDILEKIAEQYPDLNLNWLITGNGKMLQKPIPSSVTGTVSNMVKEEAAVYTIRNKLIEVLREQLKALEDTLPASKKVRRKKI